MMLKAAFACLVAPLVPARRSLPPLTGMVCFAACLPSQVGERLQEAVKGMQALVNDLRRWGRCCALLAG